MGRRGVGRSVEGLGLRELEERRWEGKTLMRMRKEGE